jgi:hypothetical protein
MMPESVHGSAIDCVDLLHQMVQRRELLELALEEISSFPTNLEEARQQSMRVDLLLSAYIALLMPLELEMMAILTQLRGR